MLRIQRRPVNRSTIQARRCSCLEPTKFKPQPLQHRGERVSIYKHCASLLKTQGDLVAGGEAVGLVGNTGEWTSGPHLHFEWWVQGRAVDPRPWLGIQP